MLDDTKWVMRRQMTRIAELEAEVARLKANASAHQTLALIYADPNQPTKQASSGTDHVGACGSRDRFAMMIVIASTR
jgi:hypothetical protein